MSVALGGPQVLGDPPRVCSFNWVTQESGGWLQGAVDEAPYRSAGASEATWWLWATSLAQTQ